ncbi:MAG: sulfatase [Thermodesulfobacteriota bacterium]
MANVILITTDATRRDMFGCYGNPINLSNFIDSLAAQSLLFTKAQSSGPYTQAAFPGLLSSSHYLDYGKPGRLSGHRTLISEVLKEAGIKTAGFHSNPYLSSYFGWNRGWDVFYDSLEVDVSPKQPYIKGDAINRKVTEWLSSHKTAEGSRPFFLWVHYMDVHEPYIPERKYLETVDPSVTLNEKEMFKLFQDTVVRQNVTDPEQIALLKTLYAAHVREVDDYVRELVEHLDRMNLLKDSTLIITSDHGDEFNEHGGLSHQDKVYSELIDIPLLIYGANEKGISDRLVSNVDIPATVVQLFGLNPVERFQGVSLLPTSEYPAKGCFGEALFQVKGKGGDLQRDVYYYREDDLKVIYRANPDSWEMYDLKEDPRELNNVVDSHGSTEAFKAKLRPRVRRWEKTSPN